MEVSQGAISKQPGLSYLLWIPTLYSTVKLQFALYMLLFLLFPQTGQLT